MLRQPELGICPYPSRFRASPVTAWHVNEFRTRFQNHRRRECVTGTRRGSGDGRGRDTNRRYVVETSAPSLVSSGRLAASAKLGTPLDLEVLNSELGAYFSAVSLRASERTSSLLGHVRH